MPPLSVTPLERARKSEAAVLQALAEPGRAVAIATAMACSEATISRLKNEHLASFCRLLAHAGLKIVPTEMHCFPHARVQALLTLARERMQELETVEQLQWEAE